MSKYMAVCDYEELKPETYNGVSVVELNENAMKKVISLNTGNFVEDYNEIINKFMNDLNLTGTICVSSSVENYIQDFNSKNHDKIKFTIPDYKKYSILVTRVKLEKENPVSKSIRETKERDEEIFYKRMGRPLTTIN